ncbi:hypothetical protein EDC94DRAFT_661168 [Helicostylum pulchrum]|nr:hypothetical protein EDC94DRAFT_661168 [Helicostylum pulchrum]
MSKKSSHAQKKMITLIIKQIYKSPKNLAKERAECAKIGVKLQYEQQKVQERRELVQTAASRTTGREIWESYTIEELVDLYVASLAKGKPHLALIQPQQE